MTERSETCADATSPVTVNPPKRASHKPLSPHYLVLRLGLFLLLSSASVASIGIWGMTAIQRTRSKLTENLSPTNRILLQIDRTLSQAELTLERAVDTTDVQTREETFAKFEEDVATTQRQLDNYKAFPNLVPNEAAAMVEYQANQLKWIQAADELENLCGSQVVDSIIVSAKRTPADDSASGFVAKTNAAQTVVRQRFEAMQTSLAHVIDDLHQPAVSSFVDQSTHVIRCAVYALCISLSIVLLVGVVVTHKIASTLRIQERIGETMNHEREVANRRQSFEARLSRGLEMMQDEPAALRLVEEVIATAAPSVRGEVLLADSSRAHLHQMATTERGDPSFGCRVSKPGDCPAIRRGHRLSFSTSETFDSCPHLKGRAQGPCSAVCIPLSIMGQTVGVLHATATDGQLPPEEEVYPLEQLASKSGERLGLLRAFRRTEAQAAIDPLTGLLNRRSLEERVHELTRARVPFSVAYGDVDHFKALNDTHGHDTGDRALRLFATAMKSSVRPGDFVSRWGGEEFVLVLPRADVPAAIAVVDRLRGTLAKTLEKAATPPFTVSFGVAQAGDRCLFNDVLNRADESLLQAKREGRNRTIAAASVPSESREEAANKEGAGKEAAGETPVGELELDPSIDVAAEHTFLPAA